MIGSRVPSGVLAKRKRKSPNQVLIECGIARLEARSSRTGRRILGGNTLKDSPDLRRHLEQHLRKLTEKK